MNEEPDEIKLRPAVRRAVRALVFAAVIAVSACVALGLLPSYLVGPLIIGFVVTQFATADRKVPSDVSGGFAWWKRRARGAFYTALCVLILLTGLLVNYTSAVGLGWGTLLILGIMVWPLWAVLRKPPQRPWDPGRLTK
ncbi:hypothetical protein [Arthrobacter bambusae]|uniref:hypothetical protein n=1 Tax=Arthrobacter bambusae TaxID=1338426 RepID=UPI0027805C0C|nr:hypothetical protein [Arthrobacter bambusae]MDQ0241417.1 hypothetical protein [Arthrobacter bambusae]